MTSDDVKVLTNAINNLASENHNAALAIAQAIKGLGSDIRSLGNGSGGQQGAVSKLTTTVEELSETLSSNATPVS